MKLLLKNKKGNAEFLAIVLLILFVVILAATSIKGTKESIKNLQNNLDRTIKNQMTNYHYNN